MIVKVGSLVFTKTNRRISGQVVPGTESMFLGVLIRQRELPKLDTNFRPTDTTYTLWEVYIGNHSWFSDSLFGAQLKVVELFRSEA